MAAHTPAEVHQRFEEAFNFRDVEALVALYEPDAVYVTDGKSVIGRANIRSAFEALLQRRGRMTLETRAVVESHDGLAVLHGRWVIEPPTGMSGEPATHGLSTEVVRKQPDGTWLFVFDSPRTPE